jgi:hypothetical protein
MLSKDVVQTVARFIKDPIKGESFRGLYTSLFIGLITFYPELFLDSNQVPPETILLYYDLILGNVLGYLFDLIFASKAGFTSISKGDYSGVLHTTLSSLGSSRFLKFALTVCIDIMISMPLFMKFLEAHPNVSILKKKVVKYFIAAFTFFLYGNMTRFKWAYVTTGTDSLDIIMLVLLLSISMSYLNTSTPLQGEQGYGVMGSNKKLILVMIGFLLYTLYTYVRKVTSKNLLFKLFRGTRRKRLISGVTVLIGLLLIVAIGLGKSAGNGKAYTPTLSDHSLGISTLVSALLLTGVFLKM